MSTETSERQNQKLAMVQQLGAMEGELYQAETALKNAEEQMGTVKGRRTGGGAFLLLGLIGVFFLNPLWPLWAFLGFIGFLTYLTAMGKANAVKDEIAKHQQAVGYYRSQVSQLRAQIAIL